MKLVCARGLRPIEPIYWETGPTEKFYAGETIWSGDGITIEGSKAYRHSFWTAKYLACNSAYKDQVVVVVPINHAP